jgi:hypothetical protein
MSRALKSIGALAAGIIAFALVSNAVIDGDRSVLTSPPPTAPGQPPVPMETTFFVAMEEAYEGTKPDFPGRHG